MVGLINNQAEPSGLVAWLGLLRSLNCYLHRGGWRTSSALWERVEFDKCTGLVQAHGSGPNLNPDRCHSLVKLHTVCNGAHT